MAVGAGGEQGGWVRATLSPCPRPYCCGAGTGLWVSTDVETYAYALASTTGFKV